ncbi:MAG: flagellar basal body-associated FliL family protein [Paracoccaceae bacterium]|nr:flagellar basal body-associated FliL family protein [Paracoccaceae bacterium]
MAEAEKSTEGASKARSKKPLLIGLALALALGGGGFYAAYSGLLPLGGSHAEAGNEVAPLPEVAFVPITPLVISLGPDTRSRHLRFSGELEVPVTFQADVQKLMPRVLDVLNGYLRAVDTRQFDEPSALIRLRAQMLRRVQIVVGEGRVRDLLVTEFVLN